MKKLKNETLSANAEAKEMAMFLSLLKLRLGTLDPCEAIAAKAALSIEMTIGLIERMLDAGCYCNIRLLATNARYFVKNLREVARYPDAQLDAMGKFIQPFLRSGLAAVGQLDSGKGRFYTLDDGSEIWLLPHNIDLKTFIAHWVAINDGFRIQKNPSQLLGWDSKPSKIVAPLHLHFKHPETHLTILRTRLQQQLESLTGNRGVLPCVALEHLDNARCRVTPNFIKMTVKRFLVNDQPIRLARFISLCKWLEVTDIDALFDAKQR
jgi:hypothetical protein